MRVAPPGKHIDRRAINKALWDSISNEGAVTQFLKNGADSNYRIPRELSSKWAGWTFLTYAAYKGYKRIVQILLEHGADPNLPVQSDDTWNKWTPLCCAIYEGEFEVIDDLLAKGAAPNQSIPSGSGYWQDWSLLAYAVRKEYKFLTKQLLKYGANPNQIMPGDGWKGWSLLAYCVWDGSSLKEMVKDLLEHNADPNQILPDRSYQGWSLLAYAVRKEYKASTKELLKYGANPNQIMPDGEWQGWSLLAYCVWDGSSLEEMAKDLLEHNADPNQLFPSKSYKGYPLVNYTINKGYHRLTRALVQRNAVQCASTAEHYLEKYIIAEDNMYVWLKANDCQSKKEYQTAYGYYLVVCEREPNNEFAQNALAGVLCNLNRYQEALAVCQKAINSNPRVALFYHTRSAIHFNLEEYWKSFSDCHTAIQLNLTSEYIYINEAAAFFAVECYHNALAAINKALAINARNNIAHHHKGAILNMLKRYEEGLICMNRAEMLETNFSNMNGKGALLYRLERYSEALVCFNKAIELDDKNILPYVNRANTYFKMGHYNEAIRDFQKSGELPASNYFQKVIERSNHRESFVLNSQIGLFCSQAMEFFQSTGEYERALAALDNAEKLADVNLRETLLKSCRRNIRLWRGVQLANEGRFTEAQEEFSQVSNLQDSIVGAKKTPVLNIAHVNKNSAGNYDLDLPIKEEAGDLYQAFFDKKTGRKLADFFLFSDRAIFIGYDENFTLKINGVVKSLTIQNDKGKINLQGDVKIEGDLQIQCQDLSIKKKARYQAKKIQAVITDTFSTSGDSYLSSAETIIIQARHAKCKGKIKSKDKVVLDLSDIFDCSGEISSDESMFIQSKKRINITDKGHLKAKTILTVDTKLLDVNGQIEAEEIVKIGEKQDSRYSVDAVNVDRAGLITAGSHIELDAKKVFSRGKVISKSTAKIAAQERVIFEEESHCHTKSSLIVESNDLQIYGEVQAHDKAIISVNNNFTVYKSATLTAGGMIYITSGNMWNASNIDAPKIYIGVNGIFVHGWGAVEDFLSNMGATIHASQVNIVASVFVNIGSMIQGSQYFNLSCLIEFNAGLIISNCTQKNSIVSVDLGVHVPNIVDLFYSIARIDTKALISYVSSFSGIMSIASIVVEIIKLTLFEYRALISLGWNIIKLIFRLPSLLIDIDNLYQTKEHVTFRDLIPLIVGAKNLVLDAINAKTLYDSLPTNEEITRIMASTNANASTVLEIAGHAIGFFGPSYSSDSLLDVRPFGLDLAFSIQKRSLLSYENFNLQAGYHQSHTFLHAKKDGVYLAPHLAWEGRTLSFNGQAFVPQKLYLSVTDGWYQGPNGRLVASGPFIKVGHFRQQGHLELQNGTLEVKEEHFVDESAHLDLTAVTENIGSRVVSGQVIIRDGVSSIEHDLTTKSGSTYHARNTVTSVANLSQEGGEMMFDGNVPIQEETGVKYQSVVVVKGHHSVTSKANITIKNHYHQAESMTMDGNAGQETPITNINSQDSLVHVEQTITIKEDVNLVTHNTSFQATDIDYRGQTDATGELIFNSHRNIDSAPSSRVSGDEASVYLISEGGAPLGQMATRDVSISNNQLVNDNDLLAGRGSYAGIQPRESLHYVTNRSVDINTEFSRHCSIFVSAIGIAINANVFGKNIIFRASGDIRIAKNISFVAQDQLFVLAASFYNDGNGSGNEIYISTTSGNISNNGALKAAAYVEGISARDIDNIPTKKTIITPPRKPIKPKKIAKLENKERKGKLSDKERKKLQDARETVLEVYTSAEILGGTGEGHDGVGLHLYAAEDIHNQSVIKSTGHNIIKAERNLEARSLAIPHTKFTRHGRRISHDIYSAQIISVNGKNDIAATGRISLVGTQMQGRQGTALQSSSSIVMSSLITTDVRKSKHSHLGGLIKRSKREEHEVAFPTVIFDEQSISLVASQGDIVSSGSVLVSAHTNIEANNAVFKSDVLKHSIKQKKASFGLHFFGKSFFDARKKGQSVWRALSLEDPLLNRIYQFIEKTYFLDRLSSGVNLGIEIFNLMNGLISGLGQQNLAAVWLQRYGLGDSNGFNPRFSLLYSVQISRYKFESLGPGGIYAGSLNVHVQDTFTLSNAIPVEVWGDATIVAKTFNQEGARLKSSFSNHTTEISLGVTPKGKIIDAGVSVSYQHSRDTIGVRQKMKVGGTQTIQADSWTLKNADVKANQLSTKVKKIKRINQEDTHNLIEIGIGISTSGSVSLHFARKKTTKHFSMSLDVPISLPYLKEKTDELMFDEIQPTNLQLIEENLSQSREPEKTEVQSTDNISLDEIDIPVTLTPQSDEVQAVSPSWWFKPIKSLQKINGDIIEADRLNKECMDAAAEKSVFGKIGRVFQKVETAEAPPVQLSLAPETPAEIAITVGAQLILPAASKAINKVAGKARGFFTRSVINSGTTYAESIAAADILRARLTLEEASLLIPGTGKFTRNMTYHPIVDEAVLYRLTNVKVFYNGQEVRSLIPFGKQQIRMLQANVGYNVSPEKWFQKYSSLGRNGTFIADYSVVEHLVDPVKGNTKFNVGFFSREGQLSFSQTLTLEKTLGLEPLSLCDGFRITRIENIVGQGPRSPLIGNSLFRGPGKGLPGGNAEIVIDSVSVPPIVNGRK